MDIKEFTENFAAQFDDTPADVFTEDTKFRELDEWSSFMALAVMAMVKCDYDVALTADEMRSANTVTELYDIVRSHLG